MPRFQATLQLTGRTATFVEVPLDVPAVFDSGHPHVRGTVNGAPLRTTIGRRGDSWYFVVNRHVREAAAAQAGDTVTVELERDDEPRVIDPPDDLRRALGREADARETWERLSYSHRKEYVDWIEEAKRDETRRRRVEGTVERLREGRPHR